MWEQFISTKNMAPLVSHLYTPLFLLVSLLSGNVNNDADYEDWNEWSDEEDYYDEDDLRYSAGKHLLC